MAVDVTGPSTGQSDMLRLDPPAYGGLRTARATVASIMRRRDGSFVFEHPEDYLLATDA